MDPSDKDCVERCRDGYPDDYRFLVRRYQGSLYAYLTGLLEGDQPWAEEATQESLVRAFYMLRKLRKPESFHAWLLGIASRVAKEFRRTRRRFVREDEIPETATVETPDDQNDVSLHEAIAALPEAYRTLILLRYYEDRSCQDIADQLSMPLGTVTKMLSRAYALLRASLVLEEGTQTPLRQEITK